MNANNLHSCGDELGLKITSLIRKLFGIFLILAGLFLLLISIFESKISLIIINDGISFIISIGIIVFGFKLVEKPILRIRSLFDLLCWLCFFLAIASFIAVFMAQSLSYILFSVITFIIFSCLFFIFQALRDPIT